MSIETTSSAAPQPAGARRYARKAVLSLASLTLAAGALPLLGSPAQAAPAPADSAQSSVLGTESHKPHQKHCSVDAHKPSWTWHHGKKIVKYPFHVKCPKGYKVEVKQHYYAVSKYGHHHYTGGDHYYYWGGAWGGGHYKHLDHHDDKKVYHVVKYRYYDGYSWSPWYQDTSHWTGLGH
ncbi:hypothetical protein AVL61_01860 [Kocuria rosea subsp. polaris]|uniref:Uncharacterized protein n=1 Tax=Kocuria rosea subsp. polaris TaxID=136273 RepID=A0A0W8IP54_KOCRO|nr:hypothetical protein [Kocuria polaris]KUG61674.1 hypothetical protein AVL61_01860 [Kocuria polaris]